MIKKQVARSGFIKWNKALRVLLAVALLVPLMVMAPAPEATPRAQTVLLAMAAEQPEEMVPVIVQKLEKDTHLEELVARLGGVVTKDLWIINAFAAELPAKAVPALARAAGMRWVSFDSPVHRVSTLSSENPTVRDEFNATSYSGNDGTQNWSNDWQEMGESDGPGDGRVRVRYGSRCAAGNCLRIGGDEVNINNRGASRAADLSGAAWATLSFSYRRDVDDDEGGSVRVQVSYDEGEEWATLATYDFDHSDGDQVPQRFDITSYIDHETDTQIRFRGSGSEVEGYFYVDNIQIEFGGGGDPPPEPTPTPTPEPTPTPTPTPDPVPANNQSAAVYSDSTSTPKYRVWNGASFGDAASSADMGARWRIMQGAESPTRDEKIVVGVTSGSTVNGQMWDGNAWSALSINPLGSVSESYWWGFDVAYEQQSGDAVLVWNDNGQSAGNKLRYSVWNGSSWTAPASITDYGGSEPQHMHLEADPNSDEMVLVVNDGNADDYALVWNGSNWGNVLALDSSGASENDQSAIYVAHEQQSSRALAVYGKDGDANGYYRIWDGSSWLPDEGTISAPTGITAQIRWMTLGSDPTSNRIVLGVLTNGADSWASVWDGSEWIYTDVLQTGIAPGVIFPNVAVAFEGESGEALAVAGAENKAVYKAWSDNDGGWSALAKMPIAAAGGAINSMMATSDPNSDQIMCLVQDNGSNLYSLLWDGSAWTASKLEPDTGETKNQPFLFLWESGCTDCIDTLNLENVYIQTIGADQLWNEAPPIRGQHATVAVLDSGIADHDALKDGGLKFRIVAEVDFTNPTQPQPNDFYGHGTHVAGVIGGNAALSDGRYWGVAPKVKLVDVRVLDDDGVGTTSGVVEGLQWVLENKDRYKIGVVNMSLNSATPQSYHDSPLNAAAEILWFNGVVVVVSAGNNGTGTNAIMYPPANDPFVITVGATDDQGTADIGDDVMAFFSAFGTTDDGFAKPDLVAPGVDIISLLASPSCNLAQDHPSHNVTGDLAGYYFRMSGTSVSSAVVAGAVALLLDDERHLTPNQVKYRLMATANTSWPGYHPVQAGAGCLDIHAAVHATTTESANQGVIPHMLLAKMALMAYWSSDNGGGDIDWGSVNWDSVNWDSVNWDSVNWDSVNWDSVNWDSVNWDSVNWDSVNWDSVNWDSVNWDSVNWDSVNWDSVNWDSVSWNSNYWDDGGGEPGPTAVTISSFIGRSVSTTSASQAAFFWPWAGLALMVMGRLIWMKRRRLD